MPSRPAAPLLRFAAAAFFLFGAACSGAKPAAQAAAAGPTPMEFVRDMGLGWNLGNTLEACGDWIKGGTVHAYETAWGNPDTTRELIAAIKAAGFKSVRIPVAWSNLMGPDFAINPDLMDRVQWVADAVQAEGMVAVVNIHWDGGWFAKFPTDFDGSMHHYRRFWSQIASRFKDEPDSLVFESLNEEASFNDVWSPYGSGTAEQKARAYGIANRINQAFVDLLRASGGRNGRRELLIAGYGTDIDRTVDAAFQMPRDPAGRSIVSVHYYTPFTFAGLEKDADWGKARSSWGTPADLAELDGKLALLKARFLDHGIPVIMGEYGSTKVNKDPESVRRYMLTVAEKAYRLGICPMLWDAGTHFDRRSLAWKDPALGEGFKKILAAPREP